REEKGESVVDATVDGEGGQHAIVAARQAGPPVEVGGAEPARDEAREADELPDEEGAHRLAGADPLELARHREVEDPPGEEPDADRARREAERAAPALLEGALPEQELEPRGRERGRHAEEDRQRDPRSRSREERGEGEEHRQRPDDESGRERPDDRQEAA